MIPAATENDLGGVQLAANTGTSADEGLVPALDSDGKLNANVIPAPSTLFEYEIGFNGDKVYLRIKDAIDLWLGVAVNVLATVEVIKVNPMGMEFAIGGFNAIVEVFTGGTDRWFNVNHAYKGAVTYDGDDIYLELGAFTYSTGILNTSLTEHRGTFKVINEIKGFDQYNRAQQPNDGQ